MEAAAPSGEMARMYAVAGTSGIAADELMHLRFESDESVKVCL